MMIVRERPLVAVAAAIAWIALLHVWQARSSEPHDGVIDGSQASQVATASAPPLILAGNYASHR